MSGITYEALGGPMVRLFNGLEPALCKPKGFVVTVSGLKSNAPQQLNLSAYLNSGGGSNQNGTIDQIQTVYLSQIGLTTPSTITLTTQVLGQKLVWAPGEDGYSPILLSSPDTVTVSTGTNFAAGDVLQLIFMDFEITESRHTTSTTATLGTVNQGVSNQDYTDAWTVEVALGGVAVSAATPFPVTIEAGTATQNVNLAQVAGVATEVGAGPATGGAVQRVAVAQDTTTIAGAAPGTAAAPSANVVTVQGAVASLGANSGNPVKAAGVYNSALPVVTSGEVVELQSDVNGNLRTLLTGFHATMGDASSNAAIAFVLSGGSTSQQNLLANAPTVFNGTSWDRTRSIQDFTSTNGVGVTSVEQSGSSFTNITTATTTVVKSGAGILHKLVINTLVASATITIYNNTAGSGAKLATITLPSTITSDEPFELEYHAYMSTGITIVTSGATDITAIWR